MAFNLSAPLLQLVQPGLSSGGGWYSLGTAHISGLWHIFTIAFLPDSLNVMQMITKSVRNLRLQHVSERLL